MTDDLLTAPKPRKRTKVQTSDAADHSVARVSREKELQQTIRELIAAGNTDRATKVLVDSVASMRDSKLNIKEQLNNMFFLARAIQGGGGMKYGHEKLRSKSKQLINYISDLEILDGGFVELGCGAHDPVSLSTFMFLNGLTPAVGIDLLPPRTEYFSALSMYDILAHAKMFPGRYCWRGNKPADIIQKLRDIDVAAFERGDFSAGLASMGGKVRLLAEDFRTCDVAPGSVALLTSFAVLEHVDDIDSIAARTFELLRPGGVVYHFVDLADHRSYRGDGEYSPLSFLAEETAPANMNRLRAPEVAAAHARAGFEIIGDTRQTIPIPRKIEENLLPRFAAMPREDVAAVKQHLVLRRPA